jgi:sortase A
MTVIIRKLACVERCLLVAGMIPLTVYAAVSLYQSVGSRLALREFENVQTAPAGSANEPAPAVGIDGEIDFSLWADRRVRAYQRVLPVRKSATLAILRIPKLNIRVPVLEGTDEFALNRGVGWIPGTARPGEAGNIGIAGHRDGFFRPLKGAVPGDAIELTTTGGTATYIVDGIEIVRPEEVRVLQPRGTPSLTLVTCYPFYYVGDAPRRFILHAALRDAAATGPTSGSTSRGPEEFSRRREEK